MRIRFLTTVASSQPEFPFQSGQIVFVEKVTAEMRGWLKPAADGSKRAELLDEAPEAAVVGASSERAVMAGAKGRA